MGLPPCHLGPSPQSALRYMGSLAHAALPYLRDSAPIFKSSPAYRNPRRAFAAGPQRGGGVTFASRLIPSSRWCPDLFAIALAKGRGPDFYNLQKTAHVAYSGPSPLLLRWGGPSGFYPSQVELLVFPTHKGLIRETQIVHRRSGGEILQRRPLRLLEALFQQSGDWII